MCIRDRRMADLMVGDDFLLMVGHDGVLLLIPGDDHLDALLQIRLRGEAATVPEDVYKRQMYDIVETMTSAGKVIRP